MNIEKDFSLISWQVDNSWKVIPGIEDYVINEDGVVKALPKIREGRLDNLKHHDNTSEVSKRHYKEHIIKPKYTSRYWYVCLSNKGKKKHYRLHRLVYKAFIGEIPDGMTIDHIDGNRDNNNYHNLRCITQAENVRNPNTKYNACKDILQIDPMSKEVLAEYKSISDAMVALGIPYKPGMNCHIGDCCKGKRNTCLGYIWKYKKN